MMVAFLLAVIFILAEFWGWNASEGGFSRGLRLGLKLATVVAFVFYNIYEGDMKRIFGVAVVVLGVLAVALQSTTVRK